MMDRAVYANANALLLPIADKSVHMIATSPPYWGLRSYDTGDNKHAELGAEKIHDCLAWARGDEPCNACYVCNMRTWAREMWRVLRDDGVMFLNLGDSYIGYKGANYGVNPETSKLQSKTTVPKAHMIGTPQTSGLKSKDLVGIPWRVALALQADGWYLRSDIIWAKPNPMPESVTDRPTKAHEYVFLLTKSARYFWDAEAVREPHEGESGWAKQRQNGTAKPRTLDKTMGMLSGERTDPSRYEVAQEHPAGRNIRTVWNIATQPFSGTRLAADYVGDDGKPYIASKDCPIHSPLYYKRNPRRVRRDEQPDLIQRRNADNDDDRGLVPSSSLPANSRRDSLDSHHASRDSLRLESSHLQSSGSIAGYKTPSQNLNGSAAIGGVETASRTNRTQGQDEYQDDSPDWRGQRYSVVAILRNSPSNRTGRAPLTNRPDTACAQTIGDTGHTQELREYSGPDDHTQANNTEASSPYGLPVSSPSGQTNGHNAYKQIGLSLNLPDISECTCSIAQVDHFATWPPALVERMVKAGTSERGVCPECGKPWERVVERETVDTAGWGKATKDHTGNISGSQSMIRNGNGRAGSVISTHIGWRPTCAHTDATPMPAIVLDPFAGSGTTLLVARQLGRIGLGFDLSETYLRENAAVRLGHDKLAAWGNGIKDTADHSDMPLFMGVTL